jgi:pimeloyl-ACP methyl ester carboxylesterase
MNMRSAADTAPGTGALQQGTFPDSRGYFVAGAGAPVVMLHASLGSKSQWTALAERLASRYRVIALDLCGYGDNDLPAATASFTLDDELRLVADHLDRLVGADARVHVVGHSYGGLVALRFAQSKPERVASLSLYEPVVFRMLNEKDETLAGPMRVAELVAQFLAAGHRHDAAKAFVDFWSGEGSYASMPLPLQASIARRVDKVPLDFRAASSWPSRLADLRTIAAPTLLLAGNRSPAVVQRIHTLLALTLSNCRVGSFEAGHMGPITHAHRVNPWIEAFVDVCAERDTALASPFARVPFRGGISGRPDSTGAANSPSFDRV